MSLWLGISAFDLKIILKIIVKYLEKILFKLILMSGLNKYIDFVEKFIFYLKKFKKLYLKKLLNLFIYFCFVYQSIALTLEYTAFKTTIEVELDFYSDSNGSIKSENFPAFSFCFKSTNLLKLICFIIFSPVITK